MIPDTDKKYFVTLRNIVRANPDLVKCLRHIVGAPGNCFDFASQNARDGYSFALAAAKRDGEQCIVALLENLAAQNHEQQ